ncbi:alpha-galactosidase [Pseudomaricurvus alkylphenolicus]|uniref:alpha-galactosidase n=1 Tax=Pseudomaricurvus alkylphenolicus TaxID=1306991 RepID=UPI001420F060|nr:alpha-galactosidase [Pseudomaricurvus alkylphenolicus]NIB44201.1 alpha-galactosidase [Pseudomaricurvus alkylphenolicus]
MTEQSTSETPFVTLENDHASFILDCRNGAPALLYWGAPLGDSTTPPMLADLHTRQEAPCCSDTEAEISLTPTDGSGYLGETGLQVHRNGQSWDIFLHLVDIQLLNSNRVELTSEDHTHGLRLVHRLQLEDSGVLQISTEITNTADQPLTVNSCSAATLQLPTCLDQILSFEGRWANEFRLQTVDTFSGSFCRDNRHGRTSHHSFPGLIVQHSGTNENHGETYGFHLGWSGNHRLKVERLADGRQLVQMGELLLPGEIILQPGHSYLSPSLYGCYSSDGLNGLRRGFHAFVRKHLLSPSLKSRPRPIHFNTWEAQYFDHNLDTLEKLARAAAEVGAERFVLDDGWFKGRRHDRAGLGDWSVDSDIYPDGLQPLVDTVKSLGMEFGLWLEPEMVNPDSDLYRRHPDWVLSCEPAPQVLARHQLALDLSRPEVQDYLFERIDKLLGDYDIGYLKWDMNRDLHQPGNREGRASVHFQTRGLYRLLNRVRTAHPHVEIESCASGGGRADYGILAHTDRIWTSDSNDALDRLAIQKGFSLFFPPEVMGSHAGPLDCHITGRRIPMATRAGVAFFGHMGMEVNLLQESPEEKALLTDAIKLHKLFRPLLHKSHTLRLDTEAFIDAFGIIADDRQQALFSVTMLSDHRSTLPPRLYFQGLEATTRYHLQLAWPSNIELPFVSILDKLKSDGNCSGGMIASGEALMTHGMQLPLIKPQTLLILSLLATETC